MDPLSILGVAAAAVQLLDFGIRLFGNAQETFRSALGQKRDDVELSVLVNDIQRLTNDIESRLSKFMSEELTPSGQYHGSSRQCGHATKDVLIRLCRQANEIGNELHPLLTNLQAHGKTKIGLATSSFLTALKGIGLESKIKGLKDRLDRTQNQIMIETLVLTWFQATENKATMVDLARDHVEKLDVIDEVTRSFGNTIINLLEGRTEESQLRARSIRKYAIDSNWQPSEQMNVKIWFDDILNVDRNKRLARAFAENLRFREIQDREESIPKTYAETCEWIFRIPPSGSDGVPLWSDFSQWLSGTSNDVYWMTGKAGAGKSTLVKFIAKNKNLKALLDQWAGPYNTAYLCTYYSWNAGNNLQKSHKGLLQSLLYQCLSQYPEVLVPVVFPRQWDLFRLSDKYLGPEWNMNELTTGFRALISQAGRKLSDDVLPFKLAIIIDGLDEFEISDHVSLVDLMKEASTIPNIKICTSSRPWNIFRDAFQQNPMLELEKLTQQDIHAYVYGHFQSSPAFQERNILQPSEAEALLNDILGKAQGVFLWVKIVVQELLVGLQEGDKLSDLRETVDGLPDDISALFQVMWERTDSQYHGEAAQYFSILMTCDKHSILPFAISLWLGDDDQPLNLNLDTTNELFLTSAISSLKRKLNSRTRGLLDIYPVERFCSGRVDYIHRTVKEWVGLHWTNIYSTIGEDFDAGLHILKGETLRITMDNYFEPGMHDMLHEHLCRLFELTTDVRKTPSNDTTLVKILDKLDSQVAKVVNPPHNAPHWCNGMKSCWGTRWSTLLMMPEGQQNEAYQADFVSLMAQIPIPQYFKIKVVEDPNIVKTTQPMVSVLLSIIIGGLPDHHLNLRSNKYNRKDDTPLRLSLVEFLLPFIPLDEVERILHIPGLGRPDNSHFMPSVERLLRIHFKKKKPRRYHILRKVQTIFPGLVK